MAKILIPSSLIPLTGSVQQSLLLAKEQGFSIDEIELGVSPTQFIQLVLGQNTFRVGTDLIDVCEEAETADFVLYYQSVYRFQNVANNHPRPFLLVLKT